MPKATTTISSRRGGPQAKSGHYCSLRFWILQSLTCIGMLSFGFVMGVNYGLSHGCADQANGNTNNNHAIMGKPLLSPEQERALQQQGQGASSCDAKLQNLQEEIQRLRNNKMTDSTTNAATGTTSSPRFSKNVSDFAQGMAFVDRDAFNERFDMGVPLDLSTATNSRVLMLYSDRMSLPADEAGKIDINNGGEIPIYNVFKAVENCDFLNVVMLQRFPKQCTAIMGQYANYHIQKWMRLPSLDNGDYGPLDSKAPLQLVNRGAQPSGRKSISVPSAHQTRPYWSILKTYIDSLDAVLEELRPIAKQVAQRKNTVVVILCNHGQSELLLNFLCAAKARGLDTSSVLVFATDQETKELAEGMGLAVFFDKTNYGQSPEAAAQRYGDSTFTAMMLAKIYCVQMVAELGHDVLFQDADVIWYRDPLEYFHAKDPSEHDIYFQDDGNRAMFYAPYSANTGFYYVRSNDLTRYFFNSLLMSGDLVLKTNSHQITLIAILAEFSSRYGMKAKVLSKESNEFPGGATFHNRKDIMKDILSGKARPYIFHQSWTENKDNKKLYFRQMGEWYVHDKCIGSTATKILGHEMNSGDKGSLVAPCCSAEAIFSCHYRDKPSREPCHDAPFIDPKNGIPFWCKRGQGLVYIRSTLGFRTALECMPVQLTATPRSEALSDILNSAGTEVAKRMPCTRPMMSITLFDQTHFNIGSKRYPTDSKGNPTIAPGQYTGVRDVCDNSKLDWYGVSGPNDDGELFIIAHGVSCDDCNESISDGLKDVAFANEGGLCVAPSHTFYGKIYDSITILYYEFARSKIEERDIEWRFCSD